MARRCRELNYAKIAFAFACISLKTSYSQKLKDQYPWYHTSSDIGEELKSLSSTCSGAKLSLSMRNSSRGSSHQPVMLHVIHVSQGNEEGKQKAFFVFGEHARELISSESAMHLLHLLCGGGDEEEKSLVSRALQDTVFVIVPNANPLGRQQVEMGKYCQRTNENGVDLNRNWAEDDSGTTRKSFVAGLDQEINPGPYAFSEPESRMLRDALAEEKPQVFLSVHSGAYLLGTPATEQNQDQVTGVLGRISGQFCDGDCPFGGLTDVIGYSSHGCDIDYARDQLRIPYAFTWEIFANADIRQFFAEKAQAWTEGRQMNAAAQTYFSMKSLMFLQGSRKQVSSRLRGHTQFVFSGSQERSDDDDCFEQFNPTSQSETQQVVGRWAKAFLALCVELKSLPSAAAH